MPRFRVPYVLMVACTTVLMAVLTGCSGGDSPSFDQTGPCTSDGSAPGAYPELESLVPTTYRDAPPTLLDSGRNCSKEKLGTLADQFDEVRFGGGTWTFGGERAVVLAVFTAPGLEADQVGAFYAASAEAGQRTEILAQSESVIAGRPGRRLDTKTGDRLQTVIVWPAADSDFVNVVISNDLPEARIQEAIDTFGDG